MYNTGSMKQLDSKYEQKLLSDWEAIFRQGLLSFWVFLAIESNERTVAEIRDQVSELTHGTYETSEQSLYRSLRKYYDLELVDYREIETPGAPKRKLYVLSNIGKQVFKDFCKRNISLFLQPEVVKHAKEKEDK